MKTVNVLGVNVKPDKVDSVVHDQLEGGGVWRSKDDMDNAAGLGRAIDALSGSPMETSFVAAALRYVTDANPSVREGALHIIRSYGQRVDAAPTLLSVWREHPELFRGVKGSAAGRDLESLLISSLAAAAQPGDQTVLEALRKLVRDPDKRDLVLAGLARSDPDWMTTHVSDWLGDDGGRLVAILYNVSDEGKVDSVVGAISKASPQVRAGAIEAIRRFVRDRDRAAHLISLLGKGA